MIFSCTSIIPYFSTIHVDFNYAHDIVKTFIKEDIFVMLQCHEMIHQMRCQIVKYQLNIDVRLGSIYIILEYVLIIQILLLMFCCFQKAQVPDIASAKPIIMLPEQVEWKVKHLPWFFNYYFHKLWWYPKR